LILEHIKNERDYLLARRAVVRRAEAARRLAVVLLAAVVRCAVDVRRFAVVLRALVFLAVVERRALDVVLLAAVRFELVRLDLLVEDLPKILLKSDLIGIYSLWNIKTLCAISWELLKIRFESILYGFGVANECRIC